MLIVRPVRCDDIDDVLALAKQAYPGMTTLPPNHQALMDKIDLSVSSMAAKTATQERGETYMLVMEDTDNQQVVGTASIIARLGEDDQFYSYKLNKVSYRSKQLNKKISVESLNLSNHFEGFAEVATLFLAEPYRKNGNGKLLAKSRYLFMANFRERFPDQVMADLRGRFDEQGNSPFWDAIGQHFFAMSFSEADLYGALNGNQFITDLMPKQPIYVNLLPEAAREVIGKPNDQGKAALAMLEKEGFRWNGYVDIFDGAPSVDVPIDQLTSIRCSRTAAVVGETDHRTNTRYLIAKGDITTFGVCMSGLELLPSGDILLPSDTLQTLNLSDRETVRYVKL